MSVLQRTVTFTQRTITYPATATLLTPTSSQFSIHKTALYDMLSPPPAFVDLSVCLSVSKITQKVTQAFG